MGDLLRSGPIHVASVGAGQPMRQQALRTRGRSDQQDVEFDREGTVASVGVVGGVGERRRVTGRVRRRHGVGASGMMIQGETVLSKFLKRNGPSGWYFQA